MRWTSPRATRWTGLPDIYRTQVDALKIEATAKRRLADEYDAAQERGEVRPANAGRSASASEAPSVADIGLTHKDIHEARQIRDAGASGRRCGLARTIGNHAAAGIGVAIGKARICEVAGPHPLPRRDIAPLWRVGCEGSRIGELATLHLAGALEQRNHLLGLSPFKRSDPRIIQRGALIAARTALGLEAIRSALQH